jgi:hypothetical protein
MSFSAQRSRPSAAALPCTAQHDPDCAGCFLASQLMCRFEHADLLSFLLSFLPFGIAVVAGAIRSGLAVYLLAWLAYWPLFFFLWEARVLCSHCPYWAAEGAILRCHANYGVVKLWRYRPGPMSQPEKVQFILGASLFVGFPLGLLVIGAEYVLALVAAGAVVSAGYGLWRHGCSRCVNFSCPANHVPRKLVEAYLSRNPAIRAAWQEAGASSDY